MEVHSQVVAEQERVSGHRSAERTLSWSVPTVLAKLRAGVPADGDLRSLASGFLGALLNEMKTIHTQSNVETSSLTFQDFYRVNNLIEFAISMRLCYKV